MLLLACCLILGANVKDTVGIDIEGYLNLRHTTTSGCDAIEVELADALVLACHGTFALKDVDGDCCLVVGSCGEDFTLLAGDGRVGFDESSHHAAHRLDTHRKRRYVKQHDVALVACEDCTLDACADGNHFVGVHALAGFFAEEVSHELLHSGDTCGTAHEDDLVDVAVGKTCVLHSLLARSLTSLDEAVGELLELGACETLDEVFGHATYGSDVGQIDFCRGAA